ncbi:MAG: ribose 5-phosphate isomerase B [Chloroflexota bacterium]|nr:MAG: ribose 5-phosphate isomerase B [Chloroflexota bacterium]
MTDLSEAEIQEIVQRIVQRTLGEQVADSEQSAGISAIPSSSDDAGEPAPKNRRIAIAADHGGYALKENLKPFLQKQGYQIDDCGTHSSESVDYPDFAFIAAKKVSDGEAWRAIIIDGAGIGSCMVANKVPGVRAAMCYDHATALNSREHNNANVLTLGAGMIEPALARQIVLTWLNTKFGGGRHSRRVDKIMDIEKNR